MSTIFSLANDVISFFEEDKPANDFNVYSFSGLSFIVNGTEIKGFHNGDQVIRAEKRENTFTDVVGIGGEMIAMKSADNTGVFAIQLSMKSVYNAFLEGVYKRQQNGNFRGVEIYFASDDNTQTSGHRGYITKPSTVSRGKGNNAQEWVFVCEDYNDLFFALTRVNGDGEPSSTQRKDIFISDDIGGVKYKFDGVLSENEVNESTITEHPVEFGANITDHVFTNPRRYSFRGAVTDTVFKDLTSESDTNNGLFSSSISSNLTRSQSAFFELQNLWAQGTLLSAQTGMNQINNLLIKNMTRDMDKTTANVLFVDIVLQEIIWTESETTTLPADKIKVEDRPQASGNVDRGNQQPRPNDDRSILAKIFESLTGGTL